MLNEQQQQPEQPEETPVSPAETRENIECRIACYRDPQTVTTINDTDFLVQDLIEVLQMLDETTQGFFRAQAEILQLQKQNLQLQGQVLQHRAKSTGDLETQARDIVGKSRVYGEWANSPTDTSNGIDVEELDITEEQLKEAMVRGQLNVDTVDG